MDRNEIGKLLERDEIFALEQKMFHDVVPFVDASMLPIGSSLDGYEPVGYMSSAKTSWPAEEHSHAEKLGS
jgi:hypothetical protein